MAKTPTYYLPEPFHTMSVEDPYLWLGRIVRHYQVPISAYTPLNPILAQEEVMESVTVENFNITLKSSMLYSAYWRLWNMAGKLPFIRGRIQIVDTSISARQVRGIRLNMEERVFKRVMANPGVEAEVKWCKYVF